MGAVEASVIVVAIEGDVSTISIKEDFKVSLDASSVGKKIDANSVILTGKSASASLLFSNGVLITIKSGSRFFLKKYSQKNFKDTSNSKPSELEEEPSQSELLAHLDFGDLIVKAPKLNKGSSMLVTSPLGVAGIRGTMFQLVAVRNPLTGDITGGVNLISGDISFTDVGGREISLVSGQSLQLASGRLGQSRATVPGGLVNLNATYGESLTGGTMPPSIEMLFPNINSSSDDEDSVEDNDLQDGFGAEVVSMDGDWEMVHEIASEIFFTIESTESSSTDFTFDSISNAVAITVPDPEPQVPSVPMSVSGNDSAQISEVFNNLYLNPPRITIQAGANSLTENPLAIEYLVKRKFINYPIADYGPFKILSAPSSIFPSYSAVTLGDIDITSNVQVSNMSAVDYSILGQETQISLYVDDFAQRKIKFADGTPVSVTIKPVVKIIDNLPPIVSFVDGYDQLNPYLIEGIPNAIFTDPGITVLDNYYSEQEITSHMALAEGLASSSFGSVNMNIAGVYEITYQGISDPSGNIVEPKTRWVEVYDNTSPVVTLYGANPVYVDLNSSNEFKDLGVFALDNLDGAIEWGDSRIVVSVEVLVDENTITYESVNDSIDNIITKAKTLASVNSTYRLKYTVTDLAGNKSEVFRQVVLLNSKFKTPTLVLIGSDPLYHEVNDFSNQDVNGKFFFPDPGVTAYKEMGNGLAPLNLNQNVVVTSYLGGAIHNIDITTVNYKDSTGEYVNEFGQADPTQKIILNYMVSDAFGNQASLDREVRIRDTTAPVITMNDDGGIDLTNLQAAVPYTDNGAVATDNYDDNPVPTVVSTFQVKSLSTYIDLVDPSGGDVVDTISTIGFWEPGDYQVLYSATDVNGNTATKTRSITVIDTIAPFVALIPHSFLSSPSTNTLNASAPSTDSIVNTNYPLPDDIVNALSSLSGYDHANNTYDQTGPGADPYINTFGSDTNFYIKDDVKTNTDVVFDDSDSSSGKTTTSFTDSWGRSFIWHSAFQIRFDNGVDNGVTLQDPGVYIRNDSNLPITVTSSVDTLSVDSDGNRDEYKVTYTASHDGASPTTLTNARSVYFLDTVAPQISLSPTTNGTNSFILIEGGTTYGDSGSVHLWTNDDKEASTQTLSVSVLDASEGSLPNSLVRTVYSGIVDNSNVALSSPIGTPIYKTNPSDGTILTDSSIATAVIAQISSSSYSDWNKTFTIKYDASDSLGNQASSVYRYLIVKDTLAPSIDSSTYIVPSGADASSTSSSIILEFAQLGGAYDTSDEQDIKNFLVKGLSATDANDFTPSDELVWVVDINKTVDVGSYDPLNSYPVLKSDRGYTVTIKAKDTSGKLSNSMTTELKVGDTKKPVLTMLGKSTIHDFLRFSSNQTATQSAGTHTDEITGQEYNATGFSGGEHRLLYHDYNFVDPGVYAEDYNSYFDISTHPDLDGDGTGEGYAMINVDSEDKAEECTIGPGLIHVYKHFEEKKLGLNSSNFSQWQEYLELGGAADTNGTIPKVWSASSPDNNDHNFTDLNKQNDTTPISVKEFTLKYYVKDGWDNISDPKIRTVYFYESAQFDGVAFYATPIRDINTAFFEDFYDNNSGNPFLTSVRKDTDGDGVSDFWEYALGTDPQSKSSVPDLSDQEVFKGISSLSTSDLNSRLSKLNDASSLSGVDGISDFNSTVGL